jgi:hypothetical protein
MFLKLLQNEMQATVIGSAICLQVRAYIPESRRKNCTNIGPFFAELYNPNF